ncbi:hypothetical protein L914_04777 [Phytophthora nicotianae]|uniref:Uncharacterized protein n=2 Tax=Phytophthora nicotianae TaxID=4792 RepID=V9FL24_PHYNI|nr:hypothetical protein F443_04958 [Phytophthora nicotianae P1569]ETM51376.1 hypothetical protein L914_04777 [Phytophthora nicotianae]
MPILIVFNPNKSKSKRDDVAGSAIPEFLISKGRKLGKTGISRMKMDIDGRLRGDLVESYQKLESYFKKMTEKNPGSVWKFDREANNLTFRRSFFVPNVGIHIANMCKILTGFDGAHLKGEMNKRGVFLVATTKDYIN